MSVWCNNGFVNAFVHQNVKDFFHKNKKNFGNHLSITHSFGQFGKRHLDKKIE